MQDLPYPIGDSVLQVGLGNIIRSSFAIGRGIGHGDPAARRLQHINIIICIPKGCCLLRTEEVIYKGSPQCFSKSQISLLSFSL